MPIVARTVGTTMVLSLVALVGILTIFTFLDQIEDMEHNYDLLAVLLYCVYSMPRMLYEIIPYGALIGCLTGLGLLASSSELLVMRAAGVSARVDFTECTQTDASTGRIWSPAG
ncbi:MAG: LptF/LptG family permease [Gammaproteobacteria bacterium]|nr:LptF/LptG family permease [Gammaproteobacteria bacterium]